MEENTRVFNRRISKNKWRRNPINWGKKTGVQWKEQEEQMQKKSANWKKTEFTIVQQQAELLSV